jgi:ribose transport system substrate-binding protein
MRILIHTRLFQTLLLLPLLLPLIAGAADPGKIWLIGFSQDTLANDWRRAQVEEVKRAFADHPNVRLVVTDGEGSTAKQIRDIEDLVYQKVDLLMTSPRDSRAMIPVISAAHRSGIPVVLLTRSILSDDYTTLVGPDDKRIARAAAREMIKLTQGGGGRIVMLQGVPTASTAIARTEAFLEVINGNDQVEVVATRVGNYLRSDAIRMIEEVMRDGIAFDAIYAQSDSMATGARMALLAAGRDPKEIPLIGIDYISEAATAIRNGQQSASFTYPTSGTAAVDAAMRILAGESIERRIVVESTMINRDNVDAIAPIF